MSFRLEAFRHVMVFAFGKPEEDDDDDETFELVSVTSDTQIARNPCGFSYEEEEED